MNVRPLICCATVLGLSLFSETRAAEAEPTKIVSAGAEWRYLDSGAAPKDSWTTLEFNDGEWSQGVAELGYGDGNEKTEINDAPRNYPTYYFRKVFEVKDPSGLQPLVLRLLRDDGAVVYLNGKELLRDNMPEGKIVRTTLAAETTPAERGYYVHDVDPGKLVAGKNVLAVEVHQATPESSDVSFDLELREKIVGKDVVGAPPAERGPGGRGPGGRGPGGPGGRGPGGPGGGPLGERVEPEDLKFEQGVASIKDRETYEKLSYQGTEVGPDRYLENQQYVKFVLLRKEEDEFTLYFMNTKTSHGHPPFMRSIGLSHRGSGARRGALTYLPKLKAPDGSVGLYIFDFQPNDSFPFEEIKFIYDALIEKSPMFKGKLSFHPLRGNVAAYERDQAKYDAAKLPVHRDVDLFGNLAFLPLNESESFGILRLMGNEFRPSPRDIVICQTLPNEMPRVAGVISEVRQTPLSHVNLRAVQDKVPNAFVHEASKTPAIADLIGKLVHYKVTAEGYALREAEQKEADSYFAALRPETAQVPTRDLSKKEILPLKEVGFIGAKSFGAKAANLSAIHAMDFPEGVIPDGRAVPFFFYDEFMKFNGFYETVDELLADEETMADRGALKKRLKKLRKLIESGNMPQWMLDALWKAQKSFPAGDSIRCRSSTNNEDLPGFSGAGLYDSCSHKKSEGHLSHSIKQVYASLWNFRAFEQREFYRIDHKATAMGVLLHPSFKDELANGVAVTDDVLYGTKRNYYLNTQPGEDMVTNPDEESSPEEVLLGWWADDGHQVVRRSPAIADDTLLLSNAHLEEMRDHLAELHAQFSKLYKPGEGEKFAMEIEFKITTDKKLMIKQARPWVYQ